MNWVDNKNYLKGYENNLKELPKIVRIASFDLDDTLIRRNTRNISQKWELIDESITDKIAELVEKKYIIVIFTNQNGMQTNKKFDLNVWKKHVEDLKNTLFENTVNNYFFAFYAAKLHDLYRKPNTGMWNLLKIDLQTLYNKNKIDISTKSFFCGDAAGRPYAGTIKKSKKNNKGDFSDTDRKFALNIGIKFITPEEFYYNEPKAEFQLSGFDPSKFVVSNINDYKFVPRVKELIIMVGPPGSGKSEFVHKYILPEGYIYINHDTLKKSFSWTVANAAFIDDKSVVVDNTNASIASRKEYIETAVHYKYKHIRCIIINTDIDLAKHLNNVRHVFSNGKIPLVSKIAYNIYKNNFVFPSKLENFDKIEIVDFIPDIERFNDPTWKRIFMKRS